MSESEQASAAAAARAVEAPAQAAPHPAEAGPAKTVAAIDIGSNSVRMVVAEIQTPDGRVRVLEQLQRPVRLGQDAFRNGRLASRTMRAATAILRDFRRVLDVYKVEKVRAVATSAVREAANNDVFVDRVLITTGLDVEVIDASEESRLTVSAVRQVVGGTLEINRRVALIVEVGGGGTLLTILDKGEIAATQGLRVGSIRLQELLPARQEPADRVAAWLRQEVSSAVSAAGEILPLRRVRLFLAVGGDARFAAAQVGKPLDGSDLRSVSAADLGRLVKRCGRRSVEELAKAYGLPFAEAETLTPALLVYQALLEATGARALIVTPVSMRDGLLLDLALQVTGREDQTLRESIVQSALAVAEKYHVNLDHAGAVARLALRLFDELRGEHGLGGRQRLLLHVAALLHEAGAFVSNRAHHKHSYYVIANAEIFGLTREELAVVGLVARYHRRSCPKPSHAEYMALPRDLRMVVSKLAALLRVADALDADHSQQVGEILCRRGDEEFRITAAGPTDLALERQAIALKADLFEDVYGMKVLLEGAAPPALPARQADTLA
jgi:exopolyphosphatase/guanosine-5'-triphosphate,3'-diphosphate pyrophosphatase